MVTSSTAPSSEVTSQLDLSPPRPWSMTISGKGPLPAAGRATLASRGTPSKLGIRRSVPPPIPPAQRRMPSLAEQVSRPKGWGTAGGEGSWTAAAIGVEAGGDAAPPAQAVSVATTARARAKPGRRYRRISPVSMGREPTGTDGRPTEISRPALRGRRGGRDHRGDSDRWWDPPNGRSRSGRSWPPARGA